MAKQLDPDEMVAYRDPALRCSSQVLERWLRGGADEHKVRVTREAV